MYTASELKYSALHFLAGKAVSAFLTFATLLLLVRILTTKEYGMYVLLVAGMEMALAIFSFGLPWLLARYLPEFRLNARRTQITRFIWQIVALLGLFLILGSLFTCFAVPYFLPLELVQYAEVTKLFLVVLILEGLSRRIRENILAPLMQQKIAQISLVVRNISFLLIIGFFAFQNNIDLLHVVYAEIVSSILSLWLVAYGLVWHLKRYREKIDPNDWNIPEWRKMWSLACNMYFNNLITLLYSPQIFIFLSQRYLGIEATALFGFLCKIYAQIANYLPATLLFNLIQPKLVASYISSGDIRELTHNANLAGKLSLFILMPAIVFIWLSGDEFLNLLSDGKFLLSGNYFLGLMLAMIPLSQHRILTTVLVAIDKYRIVVWGGFFGALSLPMAYLFLEMDKGLWGPIIAIIAGQAFYNLTIIFYLVHNTAYRPDTAGFFRLILSSFCVLIIVQFTFEWLHSEISMLLMMVAVIVCFLLSAYLIKPFKAEERKRLNTFMNKKIFIW
ncbi:Membrane protein involved in the export of O-antigen and teichoic acid [Nitrosomonas marina]|uniref:Membrane protein involved in the export of O-antigen and teichoic acid n=1 Tax=Nitrosomonas marina TaxID=917 RepID=A0A1H8HPG9_9PROT|nr:oligosaccharide flippase family protein [Nitrosomonas marina]SEN58160.1 Membrane protein involved in the export of O-antigen and teichoic acid [Nitrosomonas marina]SET48709.1 Membrane protein involved in the export of O-antigen and teichoic acid [Nitrosomonas marina]